MDTKFFFNNFGFNLISQNVLSFFKNSKPLKNRYSAWKITSYFVKMCNAHMQFFSAQRGKVKSTKVSWFHRSTNWNKEHRKDLLPISFLYVVEDRLHFTFCQLIIIYFVTIQALKKFNIPFTFLTKYFILMCKRSLQSWNDYPCKYATLTQFWCLNVVSSRIFIIYTRPTPLNNNNVNHEKKWRFIGIMNHLKTIKTCTPLASLDYNSNANKNQENITMYHIFIMNLNLFTVIQLKQE